jgi:ABC-type phosphate/phosphonate transport system substrate-binding protein
MNTRLGAVGLCVCLLSVSWLTGCAPTENRPFGLLDPFGLGREIFGIGKEPVRVGITLVSTDRVYAAPWLPLQRRMQRALKQPVQFEPLQPFQIKAHLADGRLQFAMIRENEKAEVLAEPGIARVVASPVFEEGANQNRALLVVSADSDIRSIEQLRNRRIAFGPIGDPLTHVAALGLLEKNGIDRDSIKRELLPIPGTLRHHLNSFESAKAVIYERPLGIAAGFVAKKDYDNWPDTGGSLLLGRISKDQLRILGETEAVPNLPDGPVLASAKTDAALVNRVSTFLTEELPKDKNICSRLGLIRYRGVLADTSSLDVPETRTATHGE